MKRETAYVCPGGGGGVVELMRRQKSLVQYCVPSACTHHICTTLVHMYEHICTSMLGT